MIAKQIARLTHFFKGHPFRKEILIALSFKALFLLLIAVVCFSHPLADRLTTADLSKRLLTE